MCTILVWYHCQRLEMSRFVSDEFDDERAPLQRLLVAELLTVTQEISLRRKGPTRPKSITVRTASIAGVGNLVDDATICCASTLSSSVTWKHTAR